MNRCAKSKSGGREHTVMCLSHIETDCIGGCNLNKSFGVWSYVVDACFEIRPPFPLPQLWHGCANK